MDSRWDGTGPAEDLALASVHCSCAPRASSSARFPEAFFNPPPPKLRALYRAARSESSVRNVGAVRSRNVMRRSQRHGCGAAQFRCYWVYTERANAVSEADARCSKPDW